MFPSPALVDVGCGVPLNLVIIKPGSHAAGRHTDPPEWKGTPNPGGCFLALCSPRLIQSFTAKTLVLGQGLSRNTVTCETELT